MLVLSRKPGERIQIGENITIEVRRIAGNRVTLALAAPRSVRILRSELEKIANEFGDAGPIEMEMEVEVTVNDSTLTSDDNTPRPSINVVDGSGVHEIPVF